MSTKKKSLPRRQGRKRPREEEEEDFEALERVEAGVDDQQDLHENDDNDDVNNASFRQLDDDDDLGDGTIMNPEAHAAARKDAAVRQALHDPNILDDSPMYGNIRDRVKYLNALRRQLRRRLATAMIYQPIKSLTREEIERDRDLFVRTCGINLLHVAHFKPGALSWRDLTRKGKRMVTCFVNAVANASNRKKFPAVDSKDKVHYPESHLYLETLFAPLRENETPENGRVVNGYRLIAIFCIEKRHAIENYHARRKKFGLSENKNVTPEEVFRAWHPLARGFLRSFDEASRLGTIIEETRGSAQNASSATNKRRKKTTAADNNSNNETSIVMRSRAPVEEIMAYQWLKYRDHLQFHYEVLAPYVDPYNYVVPEPSLLIPGKIWDPRAYVTVDGTTDEAVQRIPYDSGDNSINIDNILNKESFSCFFAYDSNHSPAIDLAQIRIEAYSEGAEDAPNGDDDDNGPPHPAMDADDIATPPNNGNESLQSPVPAPVTPAMTPSNAGVDASEQSLLEVSQSFDGAFKMPQKQPEHEAEGEKEEGGENVVMRDEEEEEEEANAGNDSLIEHLTDAIEQDSRRTGKEAQQPAAQVERQPYQVRLDKLLQMSLPDTILPNFPYQGSTYRIIHNMAFTETLSLLNLPHAVGARVSHGEIKDGIPLQDEEQSKRQAAAVLTLKRVEAYRQRIQNDNGNDRLAFQQMALESSTDFRKMVTTEMEELALKMDNRRLEQVFNDQRKVLQQAVHREFKLVEDGKYAPLLQNAQDKLSSNDFMSISDFLPDDHALNLDTEQIRGQHIRTHLAQHIRASLYDEMRESAADFYQDRIFSGDLDVVGAPTADVLSLAETRRVLESKIEDEVESLYEHVSKYVDVIDIDFEKRDDILAMRPRVQTGFGLLAHKTKEEIQLISIDDQEALFEKGLEISGTTWDLRVQHGNELMGIIKTSDNIPDSLRGDFRGFLDKYCNPRGMAAVHAGNAKADFDAKPFVHYMQEFYDLLFGVCKTSPQSFRALVAGFYGGLDAHTFGIDRIEPAINLIYIGDTGIGKSWCLRKIEAMSAPGTTKHFTNVTVNAFNTETSFDSVLLVFEEMKSSWLYMSSEDKERGASNEINFLKDRLTRFFTSTDSWFRDDATGRRSVVSSRSSHQNATTGASNQDVTTMDKNAGRRFVLWFVPEQLNKDGTNPEKLRSFEEFEATETGRVAFRRQQMNHALFVLVRNFMKAAVIPQPPTAAARFYLQCILDNMSHRKVDTGGSTKFHHIIQLAENIQLHFACWMGLFSPLAKKFFAQEGAPEPWSVEAILQLVTPFIPVTKDALIYALTLFDFLYAPSYIDDTIRNLAWKGLHFGDQSKWKFREMPGREKKDPFTYDPNYLVFCGRTDHEICTLIATYNKEYLLRPEEINMFFKTFKKTFVTGPMFEGIENDAKGKPTRIVRNLQKIETIPVIGFEPDFTNTNRSCRRLYVAIQFLEERLDVKFNDKDIATKLASVDSTYDGASFTPEQAFKMVQITPGYSILTDAIIDVFSNPINEKIEGEAQSPRPAVFDYVTSYLPKTINVSYKSPKEKEPRYKRIAFHGTPMMLQIQRQPTKPFLSQTNHAISLATTKRYLDRIRDPHNVADNARAKHTNSTTAFKMAKYDMDYTKAAEYMRELGHPGIDCFMDLLKVEKKLRPYAVNTVPLGCNAVSYRLSRQIAIEEEHHKKFFNYPTVNVYQRVKDHMNILEGEVRGKHARQSDLHEMTNVASFGGISFLPNINAKTGRPIKIDKVPLYQEALDFRLDFADDMDVEPIDPAGYQDREDEAVEGEREDEESEEGEEEEEDGEEMQSGHEDSIPESFMEDENEGGQDYSDDEMSAMDIDADYAPQRKAVSTGYR
jgi:hypothetical protein